MPLIDGHRRWPREQTRDLAISCQFRGGARQSIRLADLTMHPGVAAAVPSFVYRAEPTYDFEPIMPVLRALSIASSEPNFSKVALAAAWDSPL
jgi:hypothetical protein